MSRACPNCGSTHIEQQEASGACVCTECGVVLEENAIVSAVEFEEGAGGSASMVGKFISANASRPYLGNGGPAGRGGYGFSRDSRETTLANGRRRIQEVASRLRLGTHYIDTAYRWFTLAVEKNFVQGRRRIHVVAACLYIACRLEKSQHMLIDFSDALQVNVYTLGTCFLKLRRLFGALSLDLLDPALYVYRFAAHLDLDDKANAVALTALRLVGRMKRDWIVEGRRPAGICAAALLIAARAHGFSRHPQDVTRILRVCGLTITTRVKEFELTPSANLTLDQFNRFELDSQADPPIFTKNRIMEARARAIHDNNVDLLNSGALDDPMLSGKSASKWRKNKLKQKEAEFENLYKKIESEMEEQKQKKEQDDDDDEGQQQQDEEGNVIDGEKKPAAGSEKTDRSQDMENLEDDNDEEKEQEEEEHVEVLPDHEGEEADADSQMDTTEEDDSKLPAKQVQLVTPSQDQAEEEDDDDEEGGGDEEQEQEEYIPDNDSDVGQKTDEEVTTDKKRSLVSILKNKDSSNETTTTATSVTVKKQVSKNVTIAGNQLVEIPTRWARAYPKSKFGKAIILPDQSTAEERQPSLVPVEGTLDTKTWKQSMPQHMIDEIDSMFCNPTEVAQKEAIFNKMNKDYIESQAQKEKNRQSAVDTKTQQDREMLEQVEGHDRYNRKRKNRSGTGGGANTTEEALLQAVANRKISRKINYDAMSAIFDDDGTFATETGPNQTNNNNTMEEPAGMPDDF